MKKDLPVPNTLSHTDCLFDEANNLYQFIKSKYFPNIKLSIFIFGKTYLHY